MNKLMLAVAFMAGLAGAAVQAADEPEYYTNAVELAQKSIANGRLMFNVAKVNPTEIAALDEMIAAAPTNVNVGIAVGKLADGTYQKMPKSAKKWYENVWVKKSPSWATIEYDFWYGEQKAILDINHLSNRIDVFGSYPPSDSWIVGYKKAVMNRATIPTKMQLRKEGKSFVVKDNYNPVQDRLDALSKALDAPRMAGVKEACAACGIDFHTDLESMLPTAEAVEKYKNDVFYGKVEFNPGIKGILLVCLGVDEYNKFVKAYNGDAE